jgi:hypothetical protein
MKAFTLVSVIKMILAIQTSMSSSAVRTTTLKKQSLKLWRMETLSLNQIESSKNLLLMKLLSSFSASLQTSTSCSQMTTLEDQWLLTAKWTGHATRERTRID